MIRVHSSVIAVTIIVMYVVIFTWIWKVSLFFNRWIITLLPECEEKVLPELRPYSTKVEVLCVEGAVKDKTNIACYYNDKRLSTTTFSTTDSLIEWIKSEKCQISTECKSIKKVQAKNKDVKVICLNDMGKTKEMSCVDKDGTILSTKSGKMKDLFKWVQSKECRAGGNLLRKVN